jgi:hypothetical protein
MTPALFADDRRMVRPVIAVVVVAVALSLAGTASAAQLIDRNATGVQIRVNAKGEAMLTYHKGSAVKHILVWGAINALTPREGAHQAKFKLDYSGGWGTKHTVYWKHFPGSCGRYDGPALPNLVAACKSPDGSYWAAQSWPQPLPNLGFTPWAPELRANWLEMSHWTGEIAKLETGSNWVYGGRFEALFGRFTYLGTPVYGFGTTRFGAPTDGFGSLVYLDTYNSVYGQGWRRENSFVTHNPTGVFCYGFYSFDPTKGGYKHPPGWTARRGPGTGEKYRLLASGPGVTPNVGAIIDGLHPFDKANAADVTFQVQQTQVLQSWGDKLCQAGLS